MSDTPPDPWREHERNTELLNAELPDARFVDASYLHWLYDQNPLGEGIWGVGDEGDRRMAHYAVVPQEYRCVAGPAPLVFSLNAVTRSGSQRRGWFTTIGEEIYARAAERGALGVIGVSNVNSTPPVVRKLGFRLLGGLPVKVVPLVGRSEVGVTHHRVDAAFLDSPRFAEIAADLDGFPVSGWVNRWTPEQFRWRLGAPNMASPYWVHAGRDLVAVTARAAVGPGVPVILKLVPRHGHPGPVPAAGVLAAIGRYHRRPAAVYAGFNRQVPLRGVRPPRRFLPAPLNLIYRGLSPAAPKETFVLDAFEFLDMDAY